MNQRTFTAIVIAAVAAPTPSLLGLMPTVASFGSSANAYVTTGSLVGTAMIPDADATEAGFSMAWCA